MEKVTTIGLDIAKSVFQVHGVSAGGEVVIRRRLRRSGLMSFFAKLRPCLIGIEACPSAHHWARVLSKLGHEVRLMPPAYVKPYVKRQKNDMTDAEAICEAVTRPTMRFVPVKSVEQQSVLSLHRARDLLVRQRTSLINALRAHLAEYGIAVAQGAAGRSFLAALVEDEDFDLIPPLARTALLPLVGQIRALEEAAGELEAAIKAWHRSNATSQRLATIPGIGPITASALAATIADPSLFRSGRHMAAWLGLTPRESSSGGKQRLGRISKQGDPYSGGFCPISFPLFQGLRWTVAVPGTLTVCIVLLLFPQRRTSMRPARERWCDQRPESGRTGHIMANSRSSPLPVLTRSRR